MRGCSLRAAKAAALDAAQQVCGHGPFWLRPPEQPTSKSDTESRHQRALPANVGLDYRGIFRGIHLSNTTCLTQAFLKSVNNVAN